MRSTRIATLSILTLVMTLELPVSAGQWPLEPNTVRLTRGDRLLAFGLGPRDEVLRIITNAGIWFHDPKTFELLYLLGVPVDFYRFSDDGRLLATAMDDTSIAVWDVVNGTEIARLRGFRNGLTAIAFDGAAARLAVGTGDGEMLVWDIESREVLARMRAEVVRDLVFDHPENRLISANGYRAVRVWDLDSGREVAFLAGHSNQVRSLSLHRDGRLLASGSIDGTVRIWDLNTLQPLQVLVVDSSHDIFLDFETSGRFLVASLVGGNYNGLVIYSVPDFEVKLHLMSGRVVRFIERGDRVMTNSGRTRDVSIWDTASFSQTNSLTMGEHRVAGAYLNGRFLITLTPEGIFLYSVSEGVPVIQLPWVAASFRQIAFQPNGDLIAISAYQSIVIWSVETQQQLSRIKFDFTPQVIMFTPDGQRLVILDEPNSFVWKLDTRQDIVVVHDEPLPAGFTRLWPRQPRPERVAALVEEQNWSDSHWESAAMGPQGESIAVGWVLVRRGPDGSKAGLVTIVDLSSGLETAVLEGSKAGVSDLVFHPSGDYLATSGSEPFVRLWDLTEQVQIGSLAVDSPPGGGLDYHPTREVLALGDHPVFSPTGELLASISAPLLWTDPFQVGRASDTPIFSGQKPPWDGERGINLWDAHTFIQRGTLTPGADDLAFSSEGDILGSVDGGGSLMLHGAVEAVTDDINAPVVLADIIVNVDPPPPDSTGGDGPALPDSTGGDGPALPDSSAGNDSTSSDSTASVYPNPFTESLTVSFKAPGSAGSTHVAVFDVLGRRVRILAGGAQAPSSSTITWDGRDDTGRPVAAGVYLILLRDEHDTDVLKVVRIN